MVGQVEAYKLKNNDDTVLSSFVQECLIRWCNESTAIGLAANASAPLRKLRKI